MTIPGGDGLGSRRNVPSNPCVYEGEDEIVADPPQEVAEEVRLSRRVCEGENEIAADLQESEETAQHFSTTSLDVVETIDTCALEVIAPCRREGACVRFFVSAPGQHPSSSSVGFINQGNTTLLECRMEAMHLYSVSGEPVDVVYNSAPYGWSSRNISLESPEVRLLRWSWDTFFFGCGSSTSLRLQYCAGDGVFIVRAALQGYPHARRIFVVAIAPSCTIDPALCFRVRHYRAMGDITSLCSGPGSVYPDYSILPRHRESRGLVDLACYSSTFQGFLRLEVLYFQLEESIGLMDDRNEPIEDVQSRNLFGSDPSLRIVRDRAGQLLRLLAHLGRPGGDNYINLVEQALNEYSDETVEFFLFTIRAFRNFLLIMSQLLARSLASSRGAIGLASVGIPVLRSVSMLMRGVST